MSEITIERPAGFMSRMQRRMAHLHAEDRADAGYSAVEWVIIIGIVIAIAVVAAVLISAAVKDKSTTVGNCIRGASSSSNAGCN